MNDELRGKTYIAYARCAAAEGSAGKLRERIHRIRQFGDQMAMRCADEVQLAGVSGWLPVLRPDLCDLLARKREKDDFQALIVGDHARLTRVEPEAAEKIDAAFENVGVQIVYMTEMVLAGIIGKGGMGGLAGGDSGHRGR